jgi:transposase-like protein
MKYGLKQLRKDFPNDKACLDFAFDTLHSRECSCGGVYALRLARKQFQCSKCRFAISPLADTIFEKSSTPLVLWWHALWVFSNAKSGISAKELERQLAVTYKTAWRILSQIRKALKQDGQLSGDVEMDTAYFGGRKNAGKNNENLSEAMKAKSVVMGAIERGGKARLMIVPDSTAKTHGDFLAEVVDPRGTRLMTDNTNRLDKVALGFNRLTVDHSKGEYVKGDVYANTIDAFWSHIKRSINGTHKVVSKKHLQEYLDAFVFHRNNGDSDKQRFFVLLENVLRFGATV